MKTKPLRLLRQKRASWLKSVFVLTCLLLSTSVAMAQTKTVTGTVTDSFNEPLIGASILVKGTSTGAVTDMDGKYSISVTPNDVLVFSYVGYEKQEIKVGQQTVINVTLKDDSQMLAETVIIGYGSAKKRDLTGSITNIKGSEIANKPALHQWLQTSVCCRRTVQRQHQLPESGRHRVDGSIKRPFLTGHIRCAWCQRCNYRNHQTCQRGTDAGQHQHLFRLEKRSRQNQNGECTPV